MRLQTKATISQLLESTTIGNKLMQQRCHIVEGINKDDQLSQQTEEIRISRIRNNNWGDKLQQQRSYILKAIN